MSVYGITFLRTFIAFATLFIICRLIGKKLISEMTYFDYVAGITLGTIAAALAYNTKLPFGTIFLTIVLWFAFSVLLGYISLKSRWARRIIEGKPTILVQNGKILEDNLRMERLNLDDMIAKLRDKNIFDISDVEFAILETDGKVSVLPKSQKRPVTPADLKLTTGYEGLGTELVMDGKIICSNLEQVGLDEKWLHAQLATQKINSLEEVTLAYLATNGKLYIDLKDDGLTNYNNPED